MPPFPPCSAGVEKSYGLLRPKPALRGVSLRVARGECYGLAGPNGAGKTTLIRVMLGLIAPDAGEARLLGVRPDSPEVRARVGFVPEAAELPPGASPLQLIRRWARLRGLVTGYAAMNRARDIDAFFTKELGKQQNDPEAVGNLLYHRAQWNAQNGRRAEARADFVQARQSFAKVLPADHKVFAAIEANLKGL
ncbi:MAG TPA: ATP-binding cassette domain-containing protein [Myxococcales bacterium]|nr:ATP-binding cassette domain-containing protein [Myxococcales bacterium]